MQVDKNNYKFEKVKRRFNITKENMKKINEEALKKLHSWYCLQTLEDFSRGIIIPKRVSIKAQKASLKELQYSLRKHDYPRDLIKERRKERNSDC